MIIKSVGVRKRSISQDEPLLFAGAYDDNYLALNSCYLYPLSARPSSGDQPHTQETLEAPLGALLYCKYAN